MSYVKYKIRPLLERVISSFGALAFFPISHSRG